MASKSTNINRITLSVQVYQALLNAYPAKFQKEYGSQMVQVFQDCCSHALRQGGTNGMFRLWALTLLDFVQSVISEHTHKETDMSKSKLIKFSGWAFILGALAFISILQGSDPVAIPASEISAILLAVGLLGLRARYGERIGGFGRNSLLLGISGPFVLVIFIALGLAGILTVTRISEGFWILIFGGPAIGLLGLTLFGFAALRNKPMPRWNWLPILAGIWYPGVFFFFAGYFFTGHSVFPNQYWPLIEIMLLIQFGALCLLGAVLNDNAPQEMTTG